MPEAEDLIPRPKVVRERLAKNLIEARRLRSLLRLSEAAARDRHEQSRQDAPSKPEGEGSGS